MPDIFSAAISGDASQVASLLSEDPKLAHAVNERQRTALHYASREGHAGVVRTLLQSGADPGCVIYPNKEITLPRTLAGARGHDHVVAVLDEWALRNQAETASDLGAEMCAAAGEGDLRRIRQLARKPGALGASDGRGNTALHLAAEQGHGQLLQALLDLGADPDARNKVDQSPIHRALAKNPFDGEKPDFATAGLLLQRGARGDLWTAAALGDVAGLEELAAVTPAAIHRDHPSCPITIAATAGQLGSVQWLLDHGADPDATRVADAGTPHPYEERGAPLLFAALNQHGEVVRALLEAGADPNGTMMASPSATSAAYERGYDDIAADLFRYGGVPDSVSCLARGNYAAVVQAFHYDPAGASRSLLKSHDADMVRLCLRHRPQLTEAEQFSAMFELMRVNSGDLGKARYRSAILSSMLEYGFDPNVRSQENISLLHRTMGCMWRERWMNSQEVMIEFTRVLLDHGADINARDDDLKSTPMAWHARYGHDEVVAYLLSRGAAAELPDDQPWATPMAWARKSGHAGIAALLNDKGAGPGGASRAGPGPSAS